MFNDNAPRSPWLMLALATLMLAGCASDGYRYQDGYWSANAPPRGYVVYAAGSACSPWYDPFGYGGARSWYPCFGNGYALGPFYGSGYYALYDPYWPYYGRGYSSDRRRDAREQSRWMNAGGESFNTAQYPRYEDLAPMRRRDTGGGDRAYRDRGMPGAYESPSARSGIGSGSYGREQSFGGRAQSGMSSSRNSGSGGPPARSSAASSTRSRTTQDEE